MDTTLYPRWQAALDHSRYLTNLFFARPELIAELAATWEQPLSEQLLQAPLNREFPDDEAVRSTRGEGVNTGHICGILPHDDPTAAHLLVVEVLTPAGHSADYRPHRRGA